MVAGAATVAVALGASVAIAQTNEGPADNGTQVTQDDSAGSTDSVDNGDSVHEQDSVDGTDSPDSPDTP